METSAFVGESLPRANSGAVLPTNKSSPTAPTGRCNRISAAFSSFMVWMMTNMSSIPMPRSIGGMMRLMLVQKSPHIAQQLVIRMTERATAAIPANDTQTPVNKWPERVDVNDVNFISQVS